MGMTRILNANSELIISFSSSSISEWWSYLRTSITHSKAYNKRMVVPKIEMQVLLMT